MKWNSQHYRLIHAPIENWIVARFLSASAYFGTMWVQMNKIDWARKVKCEQNITRTLQSNETPKKHTRHREEKLHDLQTTYEKSTNLPPSINDRAALDDGPRS